jgi:hypothetical protein
MFKAGLLWANEKVSCYLLPILYILVPQVGQVPVVAGLSFFIVTGFAPFISFFALHLTQYPSTT